MAVATEVSPALRDVGIPGLTDNLSILSKDEANLADMLVTSGQQHLFASWPGPGSEDDDKHRFFTQVQKLNTAYPGGMAAYIRNAKKLLADSRDGKNPFDGFVPLVPSGERLKFGDESFSTFEDRGLKEARNSAFVLVAGGLGERLGYSGIKIELPSETTTNRCFLQLYAESILALQATSNKLAAADGEEDRKIPFAIMTSDDTHARTEKLLKEHGYFGMDPTQVTLLKQDKVACLSDNDAHVAVDPSDKYAIQTKPHGHGDVHTLLYSSGLLPQWKDAGVQWILFFQDTNGLVFKVVPAALGVSAVRGFDVNSLAVPRKAKEAIGGIARLRHESDGREMVINVEYNQLDPLLRASGNPQGDVNDPSTGFSPYPGNINQLVMKLEPYLAEVSKTHGVIAEFVNPKYADSSRTKFKSSTRLECMMQDFPKYLPPTANVGFTETDVWLGYSPVKNNLKDAIAKMAAGTPPHSATSGELHIYQAHCMILKHLGCSLPNPQPITLAGQSLELWPRVVWSPSWAPTLSSLRTRLPSPHSVIISADSTLVIDGEDVTVESLHLDGALVVTAAPGAQVTVRGASVTNSGWRMREIDPTNMTLPEATRIRGFVFDKGEEEGEGGATFAEGGGNLDKSTPAGRHVSVSAGSTVVL